MIKLSVLSHALTQNDTFTISFRVDAHKLVYTQKQASKQTSEHVSTCTRLRRQI